MTFLDEVVEERRNQGLRWSRAHDAEHNPVEWLMLIMAYLGKAAHLDCSQGEYRRRLVQIAALCFAAAEVYDRE